MTYVKKVAERNFLYWSLYDSVEDGKGGKGEGKGEGGKGGQGEDNEKDERMRKMKREKMVMDSVRNIFWKPILFHSFLEPYLSF